MHVGVGRVRGQPALVLVGVTADVDHAFERRQLRAQLGGGGREFGPDEQQPCLGVVDNISDLGRRQAEVDHRVGTAAQGAGQRQLQAGRVVQVQHSDAITGLQAGGAQARNDALHAFSQLRPGAPGVAEDDGGCVRLLLRPVGQHVADVGVVGVVGLYRGFLGVGCPARGLPGWVFGVPDDAACIDLAPNPPTACARSRRAPCRG